MFEIFEKWIFIFLSVIMMHRKIFTLKQKVWFSDAMKWNTRNLIWYNKKLTKTREVFVACFITKHFLLYFFFFFFFFFAFLSLVRHNPDTQSELVKSILDSFIFSNKSRKLPEIPKKFGRCMICLVLRY